MREALGKLERCSRGSESSVKEGFLEEGHLEWISRDGQGVSESRCGMERGEFLGSGKSIRSGVAIGQGAQGWLPTGLVETGRDAVGWGLITAGFEWQGIRT